MQVHAGLQHAGSLERERHTHTRSFITYEPGHVSSPPLANGSACVRRPRPPPPPRSALEEKRCAKEVWLWVFFKKKNDISPSTRALRSCAQCMCSAQPRFPRRNWEPLFVFFLTETNEKGTCSCGMTPGLRRHVSTTVLHRWVTPPSVTHRLLQRRVKTC